jgi:hypothetical protein
MERDAHRAMKDCPEKIKLGAFVSLCAQQLNNAMHEAQSQTEALSESVMRANGLARASVAEAGSAVADAAAGQEHEILSATTSAAARLQFMDRLAQQVANVCANMASLSNLLGENSPIKEDEWQSFLELTRANYTMESERSSHDEVFGRPESRCAVPTFEDTDGVLF